MNMTENQENINQSECLNCHEQLPSAATFCPNCGQKATTGLISLKAFIQNFLDNVFNLDSRIVQTVKWLFIPAKLTQEYFKGKHKTYYHPIRLYLVMSIIFFAALNFVGDIGEGDIVKMNVGGEESTSLEEIIEREVHKIVFLEELDTLSGQIDLFQEEIAKAALDSLKKRIGEGLLNRDSFNITLLGGNEQNLDYKDMLLLEGKELVEKYEIKGFWNRLFIKQIVHFTHDQSGFLRELLHNIPLMLLAMMPALALFMKLLYIRRNRFYVEHLVLNFHHHAFAFLLLTILFLLPKNGPLEILFFPVVIAIFIFLYLTMKRYYGQGHGKTFLKYVAFNIFYLFSFLIVLVITLIISLLLF